MKFTSILTMTLAPMASGQGFAFFCDHDSLRFNDGHNLKLKCNTKHSSKKTTVLDLDKCFTNDGGVLRRRDNGKYSKTCPHCQISKYSPTELYCHCKNQKGEEETRIDLQRYLSNQDGKLCCGNNCGKETVVVRVANSDEYDVFEIPEEINDEEQEYIDPAELIFDETIFANHTEEVDADEN